MFRPRSEVFCGFWGLGVGLEKTAEVTLWHWGDNDLFKAYMTALPNAKSGIVMFTIRRMAFRLRTKSPRLRSAWTNPV